MPVSLHLSPNSRCLVQYKAGCDSRFFVPIPRLVGLKLRRIVPTIRLEGN